MCTALKYKHIMGRNFDYEQSYNEEIINIPQKMYGNKHSIMGICSGMVQDYPLLYDGMNDEGLCMGGLAFTGNALYIKEDEEPIGKKCYTPYNIILQILGHFTNVKEVKEELKDSVIIDIPYSDKFPNTDLHWFICDKNESITVESTKYGLEVHDNTHETLTNNPPYPKQAEACFKQSNNMGTYPFTPDEYKTRGTETYGLPGDTTSMSRFQRAYNYKNMMLKAGSSFDDTTETLHLLDNVAQPYGATKVGDKYEYTIYSVAYDMDKLCLTIRTYDSLLLRHINMENSYWRLRL